MQVTSLFITLSLALGAFGAACNGNHGECVSVYGGTECQSFNLETNYIPTCKGNCYVYPFDSLGVTGGGFYNTNCEAFSDKNCQNKIGESGNVSGGCYNFKGGQSMKCYYHC